MLSKVKVLIPLRSPLDLSRSECRLFSQQGRYETAYQAAIAGCAASRRDGFARRYCLFLVGSSFFGGAIIYLDRLVHCTWSCVFRGEKILRYGDFGGRRLLRYLVESFLCGGKLRWRCGFDEGWLFILIVRRIFVSDSFSGGSEFNKGRLFFLD